MISKATERNGYYVPYAIPADFSVLSAKLLTVCIVATSLVTTWNEGFLCCWLKINLNVLDTRSVGSKEMELYFFPQNGISHLTKKEVFREGYDFSWTATMDLFKSWNSVESPRNLYYKEPSKSVNFSYKNCEAGVLISFCRERNWLREAKELYLKVKLSQLSLLLLQAIKYAP